MIYRPGQYVPHGDAVVRLIHLHLVPPDQHDTEWFTEEAALRAILNDQRTLHRGPQQLRLEDQ